MDKKQAKTIADVIVNEEVMPFLRSLEPQMISDEVFLSFCQTVILTTTKAMHDFCMSYQEFEHKEIWLEAVKDKIHQGVDKFFNTENGQFDLKTMPKNFFQ
ncbi:hypothetical protein Psal006b_00095 [Piscirickettsia salmonis]|uniref:Uncharacterized protein n=1 Tax=Piscirickettsia salmonis TaxID=1238 RepID=A0A1L6TFH1_PISSA|nr:hypothetical protein [Piscirickettsia salmonis]AKP72303.1 hypothetical protein PSLF89_93 [Piscirickettsia salmonis LF-89 = ATCC VR-1361]ALB24252.1 hypothetical protein KU39_3079 [Piscirickettsia salmonis]ALY04045.1 hypothetical protein AWE47_15200 [Piscirickettsia salmonis]ALY04056.1 hypothetical protein AWE47_15260 [Piscirickettsia salmonis]AMA43609.1 hypothetical protein AWJ11_15430 [Piscirickettsia salmonis]